MSLCWKLPDFFQISQNEKENKEIIDLELNGIENISNGPEN